MNKIGAQRLKWPCKAMHRWKEVVLMGMCIMELHEGGYGE